MAGGTPNILSGQAVYVHGTSGVCVFGHTSAFVRGGRPGEGPTSGVVSRSLEGPWHVRGKR